MFHENIYFENPINSRRVKELIQEFQFDSDLNEKSLKTKIDKLSNDLVIIELTKKTRDWIRKRLKRNL